MDSLDYSKLIDLYKIEWSKSFACLGFVWEFIVPSVKRVGHGLFGLLLTLYLHKNEQFKSLFFRLM